MLAFAPEAPVFYFTRHLKYVITSRRAGPASSSTARVWLFTRTKQYATVFGI